MLVRGAAAKAERGQQCSNRSSTAGELGKMRTQIAHFNRRVNTGESAQRDSNGQEETTFEASLIR
jgi:hypothetical protein